MNYIKTPNPICRLFFKIDLLTDFAALCLTDFIDWRYFHSWFVFLTQLVYCSPSTFSLTSPATPLPKLNVQYIHYTDSVWLWGGVELCCRPYTAGVLHSVSDQIQNLQKCFTPQTKMASKDDIKGMVSLKFLRSCLCGIGQIWS
jgi:hypothetical protein